jgi:hypothetical protein
LEAGAGEPKDSEHTAGPSAATKHSHIVYVTGRKGGIGLHRHARATEHPLALKREQRDARTDWLPCYDDQEQGELDSRGARDPGGGRAGEGLDLRRASCEPDSGAGPRDRGTLAHVLARRAPKRSPRDPRIDGLAARTRPLRIDSGGDPESVSTSCRSVMQSRFTSSLAGSTLSD